MHRKCCRAANAYESVTALRCAFGTIAGLSKSATTPSRAKLTPRGAGSPGVHRGAECYKTSGCKRAYSTNDGRTTEYTLEWAAIEEKEVQSERLSLYESVLGPVLPRHRRERSVIGAKGNHSRYRAGRDGRTTIKKRANQSKNGQNVLSKDTDRLHWRKHMLALTQRAQDLRRNKMDLETAKAMLDYDAAVIHPQEPDAQTPTDVPWVPSKVQRASLVSMEVLDEEIRRFADFMTLSKAERRARLYVIRDIGTTIKHTMGDHILPYVYGSQKYGTSLPFSDIDIGIINTTKSGAREPAALNDSMEALYRHLKEQCDDYICVVFRGGTFPIITAQHRTTGIDVQIVAGVESKSQAAKIAHYLETIPNMHALYAVVRTTFGMRGFVDPFIGGVSAYGTFMLLAAALTRRGLPATTHTSPGTQLLHFLAFYNGFDTAKYGLTLRARESPATSAPFRKYRPQDLGIHHLGLLHAATARKASYRRGQYEIARIKPLQPYLLCLQDPAHPANDLGKRCNSIKHIFKTIAHLHATMTRRMTDGSHRNRKDHSASLLAPLVGQCHDIYAARRRKIEDFGVRKLAFQHARKARERGLGKERQADQVPGELLLPLSKGSREGSDARETGTLEHGDEDPGRGYDDLYQEEDDSQGYDDGKDFRMGM